MRVLYDISWLGNAHSSPSGPTGLSRAIETLACELKIQPDCDLTLCAGDSFAALARSRAYHRVNSLLNSIPFAYPPLELLYQLPAHEFIGVIERQAKPGYAARAMRKATLLATRSVSRGRSPIPFGAISASDIYHSPFLGIPAPVRSSGRARAFLTCYDLIPIISPALSSEGAADMLRATLASLMPEDFILCISQATKDDLCNYHARLNPERVFVTYLGAEKRFAPVTDKSIIQGVRTKYHVPEGRYLLILSSLQPRKGMEHAIECFRRLANDSRACDLNLVVAGPKGWNYDGILALAASDPVVAKRVIFTGRVDEADLPALYSGAAAFVFPSLYEGFGLPVLEAMQCGTPVITSNTSSLPEVVGRAGILVPPRDRDALCAAILEVTGSESRAAELSRKAQERAQSFSWEKCARETIAAYKVALGETAAMR